MTKFVMNKAIDGLNTTTELREAMILEIIRQKAQGKNFPNFWWDKQERRLNKKSFKELKRQYDKIKQV